MFKFILPIIAICAYAVTPACASGGGRKIQLLPMKDVAREKRECPNLSRDKGAYLSAKFEGIFGAEEARFRTGDLFTFSFVDTSLREALIELATASKTPIVFDEAINGVTSVDVSRRTFLDALDMLLSGGPYDYKFDGRFFRVGIADGRGEDWQRIAYTHRYKTQNITPSVAIKLLNQIYKPYVTADDTLGIIHVMAPRKQMMAILETLYDLDVSPKQVLLKMNITEITDEAVKKIGRNSSHGTLFGALNALSPIQPAFRTAVLNKESFSDFLSTIDVMARTGQADVRAQPKLLVLDGVKAKFESKTSRLLRADRFFMGANARNGLETGVSMAITPFVVSGNEVVLDIQDAKSGDLDSTDETRVNENSISTKVRVREGDTLLIGGMIARKKRVVTTKVPWFGDIPYLGWLFKTQNEENATVEVVFSVSPEILCPSN